MIDRFENIIKDKLLNHDIEPPNHVFESVRNNFPRKSFGDIVSSPSVIFSILAGIIIVSLVGILVFEPFKNSSAIYTPDKNIKDTRQVQEQNISIIDIQENSNNISPDNNEESSPIYIDNKLSNYSKNVFKSVDTLICGNTFVFKTDISISNLRVTAGLDISTNDSQQITICCADSGTYQVYYIERVGNIIYGDTLILSFVNLNKPQFEIIKDITCIGDPLLLKLNSSNRSNVFWDIPNAEVIELRQGYYSILWDNFNGDTASAIFTIEQQGCINTLEYQSVLPSEPNVNLITKPEYCNNRNGTITVNQNDNYKYSLLGQESTIGTYTNLSAGNYNLIVEDKKSCTYNIPFSIASAGELTVSFIEVADAIDDKRIQFINQSTVDGNDYSLYDDIRFEWHIGNDILYGNNPTYNFENTSSNRVKLIARFSDKCESSFEKELKFESDIIIAPNIFSPNGDGISDVFTVKVGEITSFEAIITNSRGEIVFSWNDPSSGWNGNINGGNQASEGVYYYVIKATQANGEIIEKKGMLQLVRN